MRGYWKEFEPDTRYNTIKLLLDAGADPRARNTKSLMTCIHWSGFHTTDINSLRALVERVSLEEVFLLDCAQLTPLDVAGIKAKSERVFKGRNENLFFTLDYLLECAEEYFDKHVNDPEENAKKTIHPTSEVDENVAIIKGKAKYYSGREELYMRMLYWAAYRDKMKFAVKIVRAGISPFVEFVLNESAIVAAIKGGAYNTVKAIIDLSYQLDNGDNYNVRNECKTSFYCVSA